MINFNQLAEPPGVCYSSLIAVFMKMKHDGDMHDAEFIPIIDNIFSCITFDYYEQLEQGGRI